MKYPYKKYRLRDEHRQLFKNLAQATERTEQHRLFQNWDLDPQRKSYGSGDDARVHQEILEKLEQAGFLDVETEQVDLVDSPFDPPPTFD